MVGALAAVLYVRGRAFRLRRGPALVGQPLPVRASGMTVLSLVPPALAPSHLPSRTRLLANFVVSQLAWFAAVLGAAHQRPVVGTLCVVVAIGWHLSVSVRPAREARLVLVACLLGFAVETAMVRLGHVAYPSGQLGAQFAPYWMVALWGLLAIALNVTMRWLRPHLWLAAALGAVVGPAAFASGVRLGGAEFVHEVPALLTLALVWGVLLPLLMRLSVYFDGVSPDRVTHG
ncbi:DUF2878 domain-containing protein [Variovorax ginsengisoli]|uniref:DUF2878 domain-containing protein n=2 Tax=Variovorax guangxiensis TaxID=1775474 RepID=A0A502DXK6_9BURK|nr:DUF2878 domain-containing protein [Variovorax ginsengisoli]TPG30288.1 DUF2878 domain-containing protein [Variovorax guangxiensis]